MIRNLSFVMMVLMIVVLMGATIIEPFYGTQFTHDYIYTSPWAIGGWTLLVVFAACHLLHRRRAMGYATQMLHAAFVVILVGAATSHFTSKHGSLHLRKGADMVESFTDDAGNPSTLPFGVSLREFAVRYYPGTNSPMDFVSSLNFSNRDTATVSMNRIHERAGYRFYQSSYDADMQGTTLSVAYDPYGIGITYVGYFLMALSMVLFFFQKRSMLRSLRWGTLVLLLSLPAWGSARAATELPTTVSPAVAESMGDLYIQYNGRICPLETFAREFVLKIYGKPTYRGLSPVQVTAGWLFYYDRWKSEPMILIKDKEIRQLLGIQGDYACLQDFFSTAGFQLEGRQDRGAAAANEKFTLISTVATGTALQIYPVDNKDWYSPSDNLPTSLPEDRWIFIRKSLNLAAQNLYEGHNEETIHLFRQIKKYQQKTVGQENLPSDLQFRAEKLYNVLPLTKVPAMVLLTVGILLYLLSIRALLTRPAAWLLPTAVTFATVALAYVTLLIVLRYIICGHIPLAGGFEVMQFMAWCALVLVLAAAKKIGHFGIAAGILVAGFSMLVAGIGESNPAITALTPVLNSPLLCAHVTIIMFAYAMLMFLFLNGLTALFLHKKETLVKTLRNISTIMLYPALFLLSIGIFIGAIWANQSWGTYWSWDPKETWALITMMVYAIALHCGSLPVFRRPMVFHVYMVVAFLTVLMTYFGVNFLLGGMHSYA
jgi:ABC-type transport system involved in cytochrome c biogenesis permease subunit